MRAAVNLHHRAVVEILREDGRVDGGGHENDSDPGIRGDNVTEDDQEKVALTREIRDSDQPEQVKVVAGRSSARNSYSAHVEVVISNTCQSYFKRKQRTNGLKSSRLSGFTRILSRAAFSN